MLRPTWLVGSAALVFLSAVGRADASRIELSAQGMGILNLSGFSLHEVVEGEGPPVVTVSRQGGPGGNGPMTSPMEIFVALTDWQGFEGHRIAELTLRGEASGEYVYHGGDPLAWGAGTATATDMKIYDPAKLPDWFPNLTATFNVQVSDDAARTVLTTLTITAAPVPEPGSVVVFLGAAVMGVAVQRRLRRRA